MKYLIHPQSKPSKNQLVWILDPQLNERLAYYTGILNGFPILIDKDGEYIRFHFKFWRVTTPEDELLVNKKLKKGK